MKLSSFELVSLSESVKCIALEAGLRIMDIYKDTSLFEINTKADSSPLTKADLMSNKVIIDGLKALNIQYPVLSEESVMIEYSERKNYDRFWLVDPLDGTKEFIKRNGEFTVNIALIEDGFPIMGIVYVPVQGALWAIKGEGAYIQKGDQILRLRANHFSMKDKGLRVVCSRSHINAQTQKFIDALDNAQPVSKGSSMKFLLLAQGEAELYPRLGPTMEWDTAAAQMVLEEAGGSVTQYETGERLTYNKENLLNPYFIAWAERQ